jgi:hypothetical protein
MNLDDAFWRPGMLPAFIPVSSPTATPPTAAILPRQD